MSRAHILDGLDQPGAQILISGTALASVMRIIQLLRQYDREHITGSLSPLEALECLLEYRRNGANALSARGETIARLEQENHDLRKEAHCLRSRLQKVSEAVNSSVEVQP